MVVSKAPPQRSIRGSNRNHSNPPTSNDAIPSESEPAETAPPSSGSPSRTMAQLRSATIAHPQQQCTLTCYIPPSKIGAVIGRKGGTIVQIQKDSVRKSLGHTGPVRVSVVNDPADKLLSSTTGNSVAEGENGQQDAATEMMALPPSVQTDDSDLWTPVVIRGDPCGVFAAAKLIVPLVSSRVPSENDPNPDGKINPTIGKTLEYDPSDMDDVVLDVPIARPRHSAIIGRKGMTISALSADHNVRIMVPHASSTASNTSIIQLEGELENVERCLAAIMLILKGNNNGGGGIESSQESKAGGSKPDVSKKENNNDGIQENTATDEASLSHNTNDAEAALAEAGQAKTDTQFEPKPDSETFEEMGLRLEEAVKNSDSDSSSDHGGKRIPRDTNKRRNFTGRGGRGRGRGRGRGGRTDHAGR